LTEQEGTALYAGDRRPLRVTVKGRQEAKKGEKMPQGDLGPDVGSFLALIATKTIPEKRLRN